ncbi:MAG: 2-oxoglutarate dehydrogenase E1 subunit family protein, partial [Streptosporangiaceae bacterium]
MQVADRTGTQEPGGSERPGGSPGAGGTDFGPNQWLVDELYQRYQADPSSVDRAWWNFFADYQPQPADAAAGPGTLTRPARP